MFTTETKAKVSLQDNRLEIKLKKTGYVPSEEYVCSDLMVIYSKHFFKYVCKKYKQNNSQNSWHATSDSHVTPH